MSKMIYGKSMPTRTDTNKDTIYHSYSEGIADLLNEVELVGVVYVVQEGKVLFALGEKHMGLIGDVIQRVFGSEITNN